jgi:hypothetical protein
VIRGFSELLSEWDGSLIDCLYKQHDGISADLCVPRHLCNCLRYRPSTSGIQPVAHASSRVSRWVHTWIVEWIFCEICNFEQCWQWAQKQLKK